MIMKYDVIVIAGTTESREVIAEQLKQKHKVLACVATELGEKMLEEYEIDVHVGRLDMEGFEELFERNPCHKVIDASHPFAKIVTDTVRAAAKKRHISYERYERKEIQYDYNQIVTAADVREAVELLNKIEGNIFLTTGVNTAANYASGVKNARERLYIRILDNAASYEGCKKAGFPEEHVIGQMPPFSVEDNFRMIQKINAKVLVTKDSGKSGGVDKKVQACKKAGIPMILIHRPQ